VLGVHVLHADQGALRLNLRVRRGIQARRLPWRAPGTTGSQTGRFYFAFGCQNKRG
jgi:hypothetical protein